MIKAYLILHTVLILTCLIEVTMILIDIKER